MSGFGPFWRLTLPLVGGILVVDQLVKSWARGAADGVEGRSIHALWPGVFELKLVYNEGIAFGLMQGMGVLLAPVAIVIATGALVYSARKPKEPILLHLTMALLAAGAIGNLIDRMLMGRVTDMFWIRLIDFPVFNIADMAITGAAGLMIFAALQEALVMRKDQASPSPVAAKDGAEGKPETSSAPKE